MIAWLKAKIAPEETAEETALREAHNKAEAAHDEREAQMAALVAAEREMPVTATRLARIEVEGKEFVITAADAAELKGASRDCEVLTGDSRHWWITPLGVSVPRLGANRYRRLQPPEMRWFNVNFIASMVEFDGEVQDDA